jgi:predicted PurR-regulated permease PerM
MPDSKLSLKSQKLRVAMFAVGFATFAISALFIGMIWDFLIALLLAAIFSVMSKPLYSKVLDKVGGRDSIAVTFTLVIIILGALLPGLGLLYFAATQASELTTEIVSYARDMETNGPGSIVPEWMPFKAQLQSAAPNIASKLGELTAFFVSSLSSFTRGTASFFMSLFVMLYAMAFFIKEKTSVLAQLMRYSGLPATFQEHLVDRVVSISRATIKGTFLIGIAQGLLGGLGLWATGVPGVVFWSLIMMIASVIPGVGPALVWGPAVIYLFATGDTLSAIGLGLWCGIVVSTIDNFMRPALVGKDTQMPDLLVLISTLGGLIMFGAVGLVIGPVIAGLFTSMWYLFQEVFGDFMPNGPTEDAEDSQE